MQFLQIDGSNTQAKMLFIPIVSQQLLLKAIHIPYPPWASKLLRL